MATDTVANALNQLTNAVRAGKKEAIIKHPSKFLSSILAIAKLKGYIEGYSQEDKELKVILGKLNQTRAIKPRFVVKTSKIEYYALRYLPAKNIGTMVISTSQGLMTHQTAQEKKLGGCLIAYIY